jgi:ArsR family transcriptional regulator
MDENLPEIAKVFKALSNPHRLDLFLKILEEEHGVVQKGGTEVDAQGRRDCFLGEIVGHLSIGAPTISHHLKELVNSKLVFTEKKGKYVTCRVNKTLIKNINTVLRGEGNSK